MNAKGSSGTAYASTGAASAAVIVLSWVMQHFHIEITGDVVAAIVALVTPLVHQIALRLTAELPAPPQSEPTAQPPANAAA